MTLEKNPVSPADAFDGMEEPSEYASSAGVPVGGVGTGAIEFGHDAWFRNISVNNNRATAARIPRSDHTFLAVRVHTDDGIYLKRLQRVEADAPLLPGAPPMLAPGQHVWRGLYPSAHYRLEDPACPVGITWSHFAPVIPFDHDCSTMPVIFTGVRVENTGARAAAVSVAFNLENLVGRTATRAPSKLPPGAFVHAAEERPPERTDRQAAPETPAGAGSAAAPPREKRPAWNGVHFGGLEKIVYPADGEHLLALRESPGLAITVAGYDHASEPETRMLWHAFAEEGALPGTAPAHGAWGCGAVCGHLRLEPGETRRLDFVLAWFCPRFECGGRNIGTAYSSARPNALAVARHALQYVEYFHRSVSSWQGRLLAGSLPRWFNRLLVNSAHVLTTNTFCGLGEAFGMVESPDNGLTACLDGRLYNSLGTLLFFPRFSESELATLAQAEQPQPTGRLPRCLGEWSLHDFTLNHPAPVRVRLAAHFALMACRDYLLTGNAARTQGLMPTLRAVMASVAALDHNADGLPDCTDMEATTPDGVPGLGLNCIDAGLWAAALAAYARLCEAHREKVDAQRFALLGRRAAAAFERIYWREEAGYYRLFPSGGGPNSRAVHAAQLTGAWYAEFLGIEDLFNPERVDLALTHIARNNTHAGLVASACLPGGTPCSAVNGAADPAGPGPLVWPGHLTAHYAALLVHRGRVAEGMAAAERVWNALRDAHGDASAFNAPLNWNPLAQAPPPGAPMRHAAALAVWHVLYAIEGFLFQVPGQHLRIMPNLPPGIATLSAPLLTPVCLGWLNYKADRRDGYRQRLRVRLDSPIQVRSFELRVPLDVPAVQVTLRETDGPPVPVSQELRREGGAQRLFFAPRHPDMVASDILIEVVQAEPDDRSDASNP